MKSTLPIRSTIFWFAIGVMVFFTMAASSPQCARSDNSINPVLETQADGNPCVFACQDDFKIAKRELKEDYREAKALCEGDYDCLQEAAFIRDQLNDEIVADKDACIAACNHEQGIATGGQ
jgi:hypothetical protein